MDKLIGGRIMTDRYVDTEREREEKERGKKEWVRSHVLLFRSKQPLQEGVHASHDKWMASKGTDDLTLIPNYSYHNLMRL